MTPRPEKPGFPAIADDVLTGVIGAGALVLVILLIVELAMLLITGSFV